MAADLELAAVQMCAHLNAGLIGRGGWFLLAIRDAAGVIAARLVAPLHVDPGTGAVAHGAWAAASDEMMEPRR
ncbi:hypothetical protein [Nocardia sp. XZ_19_385]|uniref:hypothetical protein n=1 Tax=Nocardia sp. XZ_19_385 TaxID=2769488 RepID=UPI00188E53C6|nr:hypothetical protein [Nocardia sp. XZ_19_385]